MIAALRNAGLSPEDAARAVAAQASFPPDEQKERYRMLLCAAIEGVPVVENFDATPFTLAPIEAVKEADLGVEFADIPCRACKSPFVRVHFAQARSADEGQTAFITCKKCNSTYNM